MPKVNKPKILIKIKVGFSFCFDVSALRNAGQTFFCDGTRLAVHGSRCTVYGVQQKTGCKSGKNRAPCAVNRQPFSLPLPHNPFFLPN
jgi:hypothetical protein